MRKRVVDRTVTFVPDLLEETLHPLFLVGLECNAIHAGCAGIGAGAGVGGPKRLDFEDINVQTSKSPGQFGLRHDV